MTPQQIETKFYELYAVALQKFPSINLARPKVEFTTRGTAAGKAYMGLNKVQFNSVIAENATKSGQDFTNTISHELAHLVQYKLYPKSKPHGAEFRNVHRRLGGTGERCHQYSVEGVSGRQKRHAWVCGCKTHHVTTVKHNKMLKWLQVGLKHRCSKCKEQVLPKNEF